MSFGTSIVLVGLVVGLAMVFFSKEFTHMPTWKKALSGLWVGLIIALFWLLFGAYS